MRAPAPNSSVIKKIGKLGTFFPQTTCLPARRMAIIPGSFLALINDFHVKNYDVEKEMGVLQRTGYEPKVFLNFWRLLRNRLFPFISYQWSFLIFPGIRGILINKRNF
jgi:hypothetical protein